MTDRRLFLSLAGTAALLACQPAKSPEGADDDDDDDVSATEDLMREHGVIRRVLVVYRESASRLRASASAPVAEPVRRAAALMRKFGEDYHEKQLEEARIFPALAKTPVAALATTLVAQHQRSREITDAIIAGKLDATTLEAFARMYEEHTAFEDTIIFPAWKKTLSKKQLAEMAELFEQIEHQSLGKEGFEGAVAQIADIEKALGIDLAALTAPAV